MKLKKYIMTIGAVSLLALSIAACSRQASNNESSQGGSAAESGQSQESTTEEHTIAYDESVKQLELDFNGIGNLIGIPYEEIVTYKQEPKDDQKTEGKRTLVYENPAVEFVLYPDAADPLNEEGYLSQAIRTDVKTAWGLDEDMPVKDFVNAVSATTKPVYGTVAETDGDLMVGNVGQKTVEFESYGYLFRVAYDGDTITPDSKLGAFGYDLVDSVRKN